MSTWWQYVAATSGTESPKVMSDATGISGPDFSKWKGGHVPGPDKVARFARAYRRPVLEAFVAAGFLTPNEAKVRPAAAPDFSTLTNDELLALVRERMEQGGEADGDSAAPNTSPGSDDGPGSVAANLPTIGQRERRVGKVMPDAARDKTNGQG